jgi:hypothetical protein
MKAKMAGTKSNQGRRVSSDKQDSTYSASREFAKLVINEPLVYNNYGKVSARKHTLEKDLGEERIEDLLQRKSK